MALSIGSEVGPYKILSKLGAGGMGEVYRAKDSRLDREVAIKVLPDDLAEDLNALKRFEREAKLLAALSHPNILAIHDVGTGQGISYVITELLKGEPLRQTIRGGRLPWRRAVEIAIQVAEGLSIAHSNGIVHRDLKPENIFIIKDGHVKILDFGLARQHQVAKQEELSLAPTESKVTVSGTLLGTIPYMSPEQVRGDPVDTRSDIFSAGCVLYEMLTAHRPFSGNTAADTMAAILKEDPVNPANLEKDVPPALIEIVKHCLEKNPEQRFQSARDLAFGLKSILTSSITSQAAATTRREVSLRRPRKVIGIAAVAAAVILAFLFALNIDWLKRQIFKQESVGQIKTLAVLPLKNLSADPGQEYIADAMTEELITAIARIESLQVISRTSVMGYKGIQKPLPAIAQELKVDAIVEGSVVLIKDRIRITAQLIHATTDQHIWAQSYDRDLRDILALQNEVASSIAQQIQIKLTPQEKAHLASADKVRPDAYQAYLRGRYLMFPPDLSETKPLLAVEMFERAVGLDPQFALAYAELSRAHSLVYFFLYDRTHERLTKAKAAVDRAFQLQPGLAEAHQALGYYYYAGYKDYDRALQEYSIAEKELPSNTTLLTLMGAAYRRMGNFQAATEKFKRVFELSPREASAAWDIGSTFSISRKYAEADRYFHIAISLAPDQSPAYLGRAMNYLLWKGETRDARAVLEKMPETSDPDAGFTWFLVEMCDRNYKAALDRLHPSADDPIGEARYDLYTGFLYHQTSQPKLARAKIESARDFLEKFLEKRSESPAAHSLIGLVYAFLGRKEDAIREGKAGVDLMPVSKDAVWGPYRIEELAWIYVLASEYEAALDQLEYVTSIPAQISVPMLRIDPRWDPLRNHPRFQKLLQRHDWI